MTVSNGNEGFSLIELLVVTMVIGVLATIAIPNMMSARTRARVARAKAELNHCSIALESYYIDASRYPNDCEGGWCWRLTRQLTTPVRYMTAKVLTDNFLENSGYPEVGCRHRYINYEANVETAGGNDWGMLAPPLSVSADRIVLSEDLCRDGMSVFGKWKVCSAGPDRSLTEVGFIEYDVPYDPTNGTTSQGDIVRCQIASFPKLR